MRARPSTWSCLRCLRSTCVVFAPSPSPTDQGSSEAQRSEAQRMRHICSIVVLAALLGSTSSSEAESWYCQRRNSGGGDCCPGYTDGGFCTYDLCYTLRRGGWRLTKKVKVRSQCRGAYVG